MRTAIVVVVVLLLATTTARAEPWYRGRYGKNRIVHLSIAVGGGILYVASVPIQHALERDTCWACHPTAIDVVVRDAVLWKDTKLANTLSNINAYGVTPIVSVGLVLAGTLADPSTAAEIDDLTPIAETVTLSQWVAGIIKVSVSRQRPYAHFVGAIDKEDNLSFLSGHTTAAFSVAVSAAVVAHMRGYKSEPYLWVAGGLLAATTGYLRIAADRHYFTDVLAGALLGSGAGLTVPLLMKREVSVVPTRDGIALAGEW